MQQMHILPIDICDISTLPLFSEDMDIPNPLPQEVANLRDQINTHDGILLVTPEYNWTIPAPLTNVIDWISSNQVNLIDGKPFAIAGATDGGFGTTRVQMQLKLVLFHLGAKLMNKPDLLISRVDTLFNKQSELIDKATEEHIKKFLESFKTFLHQ